MRAGGAAELNFLRQGPRGSRSRASHGECSGDQNEDRRTCFHLSTLFVPVKDARAGFYVSDTIYYDLVVYRVSDGAKLQIKLANGSFRTLNGALIARLFHVPRECRGGAAPLERIHIIE